MLFCDLIMVFLLSIIFLRSADLEVMPQSSVVQDSGEWGA